MHPDDAALAAELAERAGRLLVELRARGGPDLGGAGDRAAHELITGALAAARPADVVVSEEAAADPARLSAERVWLVDPLDGTREYSEPPREDWAVHVALWQRGELVAGAVALPALGRTLRSDRPPPLPETAGSPPVMVVSRSRAPEFAPELARRIGARLETLGSAGAKVAAVVTGRADAYVHAAGINEWDTAAPVVVARAAGLHASRLDGSPLAYNAPDLRQDGLLVARPEFAGPLLAALGALGSLG